MIKANVPQNLILKIQLEMKLKLNLSQLQFASLDLPALCPLHPSHVKTTSPIDLSFHMVNLFLPKAHKYILVMTRIHRYSWHSIALS